MAIRVVVRDSPSRPRSTVYHAKLIEKAQSEPATLEMENDLELEIQKMFMNIYEATDLKYLRPIKRDMFTCSIKCLDEENSLKKTEECMEDCSLNTRKAMTLFQKEMNSFQGRIDRCLMDCQDDVRIERDEKKARRLFNECAEKCVKKYVPVVPEVIRSLCDGLSKLRNG